MCIYVCINLFLYMHFYIYTRVHEYTCVNHFLHHPQLMRLYILGGLPRANMFSMHAHVHSYIYKYKYKNKSFSSSLSTDPNILVARTAKGKYTSMHTYVFWYIYIHTYIYIHILIYHFLHHPRLIRVCSLWALTEANM